MAIKNIVNINQFFHALLNASDDDVLDIKNDLDYNSVESQYRNKSIQIPEPTEQVPQPVVHNLIINGNGHAIRNLVPPTETIMTLFQVLNGGTVTFNDLSFLNCAFAENNSHLIWEAGATPDTTVLNNCVIQGRFYSTIASTGGCITFDSCMITVDHGIGAMNDSAIMRNCWINLIRHQQKNNLTDYVAVLRKLDTCYVTGNLRIETTVSNPRIFRDVNNCCINIDVNCDAPDTSNTNFVTASNNQINVINKTKIQTVDITAWEDTPYNKLVTDEQMKNAEYLADVGFNIIP